MPLRRIRVWLPDRPGALGAVASRLGALRGDVVRVDVIERGVGQAIDEFVVELPGGVSDDLLNREISDVDGVRVEAIDVIDNPDADRIVAVAALARSLAQSSSIDVAAKRFADGVIDLVHADWAVVARADGTSLAAHGADAPAESWVSGFVRGRVDAGGAASVFVSDGVGAARSGDIAALVARARVDLRPAEMALVAELVALLDHLAT